jgi:hypothetical protein
MDLLRHRGFALLCTGQFLSMLADWGLRAMVLIWIYQLTHSGGAVSAVGLAQGLPLLLLAPLAGVYMDRWSRASASGPRERWTAASSAALSEDDSSRAAASKATVSRRGTRFNPCSRTLMPRMLRRARSAASPGSSSHPPAVPLKRGEDWRTLLCGGHATTAPVACRLPERWTTTWADDVGDDVGSAWAPPCVRCRLEGWPGCWCRAGAPESGATLCSPHRA